MVGCILARTRRTDAGAANQIEPHITHTSFYDSSHAILRAITDHHQGEASVLSTLEYGGPGRADRALTLAYATLRRISVH